MTGICTRGCAGCYSSRCMGSVCEWRQISHRREAGAVKEIFFQELLKEMCAVIYSGSRTAPRCPVLSAARIVPKTTVLSTCPSRTTHPYFLSRSILNSNYSHCLFFVTVIFVSTLHANVCNCYWNAICLPSRHSLRPLWPTVPFCLRAPPYSGDSRGRLVLPLLRGHTGTCGLGSDR